GRPGARGRVRDLRPRRRGALRRRRRPGGPGRGGPGEGRRPGGRRPCDAGGGSMTAQPTPWDADPNGWFGNFGGRFMPEALVAALDELTVAWQDAIADETFLADFAATLRA